MLFLSDPLRSNQIMHSNPFTQSAGSGSNVNVGKGSERATDPVVQSDFSEELAYAAEKEPKLASHRYKNI